MQRGLGRVQTRLDLKGIAGNTADQDIAAAEITAAVRPFHVGRRQLHFEIAQPSIAQHRRALALQGAVIAVEDKRRVIDGDRLGRRAGRLRRDRQATDQTVERAEAQLAVLEGQVDENLVETRRGQPRRRLAARSERIEIELKVETAGADVRTAGLAQDEAAGGVAERQAVDVQARRHALPLQPALHHFGGDFLARRVAGNAQGRGTPQGQPQPARRLYATALGAVTFGFGFARPAGARPAARQTDTVFLGGGRPGCRAIGGHRTREAVPRTHVRGKPQGLIVERGDVAHRVSVSAFCFLPYSGIELSPRLVKNCGHIHFVF